MSLLNYTKLLFLDCKKSLWKIVVCLFILIFGVITASEYTSILNTSNSIPDVFNNLFTKGSLITLTVPLFLFFLSFVIPVIIDPLRLARIKERKTIGSIMILSVLITVIVFLCIYFICGFLYGWWKSGSLENLWVTEAGTPFKQSKGQVDLSLFSTGNMILRYTVTEFFAFMAIGLLTAFLYLLVSRYVLVFFIVVGFVLLDTVIQSLFHFTFILLQAAVTLDGWGNNATFFGNVLYFFGIILILCLGIYIAASKRDFIPISEEND
ncbi:hypothetical protein MXL46_16115 [Heyndrickxia sporothermodurans]|uniref:Uncharacterized protein n=1 Tax=Heyndrickxia sporothermodurans TaxID=46224 RepID=A0A150KLU0_9BACI|nr:hypothetical protein [Heyndrickxia sporothermodurans]KYC92935.1 hypothetical protein B4102_2045 [Heyndrickxia sporothermodurans]MBL5768573.1 hypothetical protein [Heyndrickxia sporothermodurans]MBL5772260.1 hypothetical protein [Heyndrickxia sporothermodurans]MBL5775820.1 hypothetical protein [Heyndrickxia sporothermodurans]MBL5779354.1 hypothetical protein [Heyndrickxia sporothermodurans]